MADNIIDGMLQRVKKEVLTDQNMTNIPLAYLMTRNIPDSVKHFFDQEVEIWIREEEEKFTSSDRFDYDMPEVRMLIDKIFDVLKQNAYFHVTKFNQLLERAVKLEMNYLITPHRTLTQFLFKNSPMISTIEVYDTLKYFFRYDYYKNAISDYFNAKYLREISQDQFEDLMRQIDEKAFSENKLETTLKTIKAIFGFMCEALEEDCETISIDILKKAFEDRYLSDYIDLLSEQEKAGKSELSLGEIEKLLSGEVLEEEEVQQEEPAHIEEIDDIEESKPTVEVEEIDLKEAEVPVEEEEEEEEEEEVEEEEEIVEKEAAAKKPAGGVAGELADFVAGKIKSDSPLQDLNEIITGRNRRKILKKLFKKKENNYNKFIEQINVISTWKEASQVIDDEFYDLGINPYSKEALLFSDLIYTRFFPKDKYVGDQQTFDKF